MTDPKKAFAELRACVDHLARVRDHVLACPVSYKFDEAGNLVLWIPDARPDRGLQIWLRELDIMLGLKQGDEGAQVADMSEQSAPAPPTLDARSPWDLKQETERCSLLARRVNELENTLRMLDWRGGLGLDVHDYIRKTLNGS